MRKESPYAETELTKSKGECNQVQDRQPDRQPRPFLIVDQSSEEKKRYEPHCSPQPHQLNQRVLHRDEKQQQRPSDQTDNPTPYLAYSDPLNRGKTFEQRAQI